MVKYLKNLFFWIKPEVLPVSKIDKNIICSPYSCLTIFDREHRCLNSWFKILESEYFQLLFSCQGQNFGSVLNEVLAGYVEIYGF